MRFTRISLILGQATKIHSHSLLRNPSLCRSYIVGSVFTSPTLLISSYIGDIVTGLSYPVPLRFIGHTTEQFSDDEYECEFEEHKVQNAIGFLKMIGALNVKENLTDLAERVESVVRSLKEEFGEHVWGTKCDLREGKDVKELVTYCQTNLIYIGIWINNAGSNAYSFRPLPEASDEDLIEVVKTNTLGLMLCCREAMNMMLTQSRGVHIFNIDGAGADGKPTPRFAAYGATKRSVVHMTKSIQAELEMQDVKNVVVHNLSLGMVTTELLMSGAITKQAKFFINVLAEPAEVVAEYLV